MLLIVSSSINPASGNTAGSLHNFQRNATNVALCSYELNNPVPRCLFGTDHCPKGEGEGQRCGQGQDIFDILLQPLYVPAMTIGNKLRFLPPPP